MAMQSLCGNGTTSLYAGAVYGARAANGYYTLGIDGTTTAYQGVLQSNPNVVFVSVHELEENFFLRNCHTITPCYNRNGFEISRSEYEWATQKYRNLQQARNMALRSGVNDPFVSQDFYTQSSVAEQKYQTHDPFREQYEEQIKHDEEKARKEKERADAEYLKKEKKKKHDNNIKKLYWARKSKEENK